MHKLKKLATAFLCAVCAFGSYADDDSGSLFRTPYNTELMTRSKVEAVANQKVADKRSVSDENVYVQDWNFSAFERIFYGTYSIVTNTATTTVLHLFSSSTGPVDIANLVKIPITPMDGLPLPPDYFPYCYKVDSIFPDSEYAERYASLVDSYILHDVYVKTTDRFAYKSELSATEAAAKAYTNNKISNIDLGAKRDKTDELVYSQTEVDWDFSELTKIDPTKLYSIRTEMDSDGETTTYTYWLDRRISGGGGSLIELEKHPDDASVSNENLTRFVIKRVLDEAVDAAFKSLIGTIIYKRGVATGDTFAHESEKADAEVTTVNAIIGDVKLVIGESKGFPIRNLEWYYSKGTVANIKLYDNDNGEFVAAASAVSDWDGSVPSFVATFRFGEDEKKIKISDKYIWAKVGDDWGSPINLTLSTRVAKNSTRLDGHTYNEVIAAAASDAEEKDSDLHTTISSEIAMAKNEAISETKDSIRRAISSSYAIKGPCLFAELPTTDQKEGDIWIVTDRASSNFVWVVEDGSGSWKSYSPSIDISAYATKTYAEDEAADAVKMTKDITPTIDVGNAKAGETISCNGKTVQWLLEEILAKDRQPSIVTPSISSLSMGASPSMSVEVGTTVTPSYTVSASLGSYTYGVLGSTSGTATGCSWTKFVLTDSNNATFEKTSTSGSLSSFVVTDNTGYYLKSVTGSYSAGGTPQTYNHVAAESSPIAASSTTKNQNTSSISGYRQYFIFVGSKAVAMNSANLRGVGSDFKGNAKTVSSKSVTIGSGVTRFAVALPAGSTYTKTLKKAVNSATGYNEFSFFAAPVTVSVAGASDGYDMNYNVYIWDRSDTEGPFEPTTFTLTIE